MEIQIRQAKAEDLPSVRRICFVTCTDEKMRQYPEALSLVYADYYLEHEIEHCFVACDGEKVIGYILSNYDPAYYLKTMRENILPTLAKMSPYFYTFEKKQIGYAKYWKSYPAHLHIDLDPAYQAKGIGGMLMKALLNDMKEHHIKAVHLGVSNTHKHAIRFYKKNGFHTLVISFSGRLMGRKL
jgi:ribosomal protein S18 acetylase RimI-like enzyme